MLKLGIMGLLGIAVLTAIRPIIGEQREESELRSRFAGEWKLVSCERKASDGTLTYPYGDKPVGRITYEKAGRMSVQIMRPGRSQAAGRTLREASVDVLREVVDGYIAYFGTFGVDPASRTVVHHVQACLVPSWVGTTLKRTYEFEDNRLILTAESEDGTLRLTWQREPD